MRRGINGRYKGLLEVWDEGFSGRDYSFATVDFLHRSVCDFLQIAPIQAMLLPLIESDFNADQRARCLYLAQLKMMPDQEDPSNFHHAAISFLHEMAFWPEEDQNLDSFSHRILNQLGELFKSRREMKITTDAEYVGLLAMYGQAVYIRKYMDQYPRCTTDWKDFSPLHFFLSQCKWRERLTGLPASNTGYLSDPERRNWERDPEIAAAFLEGGLNPSNDCQGTSTWKYLASLVTAKDKVPTRVAEKTLSPLIRLCLKHGAGFFDLTSGEDGYTWVKKFVSFLGSEIGLLCPYGAASYEFLEMLIDSGFDPTQCHDSQHGASLWQMFMEELLSQHWASYWIDDDKRDAPVKALELCLKHAADANDPILLEVLDKGGFSPDGSQRIRTLIQGLASKKEHQKDNKRKRLNQRQSQQERYELQQ